VTEAQRGPWAEEGVDLVRAASGGLLLGVPLVFTNEVWGLGRSTNPARALVALALTALVLVVLNRSSGFRDSADVRTIDAAADAIEGLAVGVVIAAVLMLVIRQITLETPLPAALWTVAYEAVPCALGVGLARHILREKGDDAGDDNSGGSGTKRRSDLNGTLIDLGATILGATVVAISIAPTQEVLQVAATMTPANLLLLVATSLLASYCIVFVAGFSDQEHRRSHEGVLQSPISETVAAYLVSLVVAAGMLWFFEVVDLSTPNDHLLTTVVVLGLPACIGGAAGRLAT
jgi:putative integral membrane protein (TIGR02587 family)